jgi:hypothetical protein
LQVHFILHQTNGLINVKASEDASIEGIPGNGHRHCLKDFNLKGNAHLEFTTINGYRNAAKLERTIGIAFSQVFTLRGGSVDRANGSTTRLGEDGRRKESGKSNGEELHCCCCSDCGIQFGG